MKAMIEVENIKKSFKDFQALDGVTLSVPEGSVQALLGPNGAGKTTLVRIMTTLMKPDEGKVTIAGLDAFEHTAQLRQNIGLTGQYAAIDEDLTGYENLRMFGKLYHLDGTHASKRARALLEEFHLTDAGDKIAKTYSGGMRRRLDLAASLIVDPPVLFLDEPTTGLDPASRLDLWENIRSLVAKGTTVLLTTQYLEEADQLADNIAVINKGKIIAQGTASELKEQSGGNVLEVTIKDAMQHEKALAILQKITQQIEVDEKKVHFQAPITGGAEILIDVVRQMDTEKVDILDIQLRRPTLDDVFIALTGETTEK